MQKSNCANDDLEARIVRYGDLVYRIACTRVQTKADADDVFQNVFLLLFQKNPTFETDDHCRNWLINVTLKYCKKLRFASNSRRVTLQKDFPLLQKAEEPETMELFWAVQSLPALYRVPIWLYYYEGFSTAEIAQILHQKESTIRSRLKRGREKLKGALQ